MEFILTYAPDRYTHISIPKHKLHNDEYIDWILNIKAMGLVGPYSYADSPADIAKAVQERKFMARMYKETMYNDLKSKI